VTTPHLISALEDLDDPAPAFRSEHEDAPARRQPGALVELFVEGEAPYIVRVTNRERIGYEKAAARHREWPAMEQGQHFAMTFVCWAAAKRAGHTSLTFEAFADVLEDYDVLDSEPADPTR
jgi:hypothetical protein